MTSEEKLIRRILDGNRTVELAEVDSLLMSLGFRVKRTTHTFLYSKDHYRITLCAHSKVLHPKAIKELRMLLLDLNIISKKNQNIVEDNHE